MRKIVLNVTHVNFAIIPVVNVNKIGFVVFECLEVKRAIQKKLSKSDSSMLQSTNVIVIFNIYTKVLRNSFIADDIGCYKKKFGKFN